MKIIFRILALIGFLAIIGIVIAFGRGYRWSFKNKTLTSTGILSINSTPNAAKVYLNGTLKGVTDISLVLSPGDYQIEIKKDGYTGWSKSIKLRGELVYTVDTQLFPLNPSLSPLTNLGIVKTVPVDQTEKIIVFSDTGNPDKDGIYLFEATNRPLSLFPPLKLLVLKKNLNLAEIDFTMTDVYFSADYKEAIFDFNPGRPDNLAYLLSLDGINNDLFEVTASKTTLIAAYEEERKKEIDKILETFPAEIAKTATSSFAMIGFSPDKTKFFYQATAAMTIPLVINPPMVGANQTVDQRSLKENDFYVYDRKEDKNFKISDFRFPISKQPASNQSAITNYIQWFPDSKHLIFLDGKKIAVVDYDGYNKQTIYSGPFESSFFVITADGKIIILANLNPENNQYPDLYSVGIR